MIDVLSIFRKKSRCPWIHSRLDVKLLRQGCHWTTFSNRNISKNGSKSAKRGQIRDKLRTFSTKIFKSGTKLPKIVTKSDENVLLRILFLFFRRGTLVKSSLLLVFRFSQQIGMDFPKILISVQNTDNRNG